MFHLLKISDMCDKNLFNGVGVVIDDHVLNKNEHNDKIIQLVDRVSSSLYQI